MAITTLDGALAGMQPIRSFVKSASGTLVAGRPQSYWPVAGNPGAGTYDTTLNGATLSSSSAVPAGALYHQNPGSGNAHLARLTVGATIAGTILLCDRLWVNQLTVNSTGLQSITSPTWPARDASGATTGDGVHIAIETSAAASATAVAGTLTYTNTTPTGSRTSTIIDATAASATIAGAFFRLGLQAGDTGVKSVESFQFSTAWTTGTINLVAYRVLAAVEVPIAGTSNSIDAITGGFPRLYDGVVPFFVFIPTTTTTTLLSGAYVESQG
jgi:hypothetical protein